MRLRLWLLCSCWLLPAYSEAADWELYKDRQQVKVEYRRLDNSLLEIRAQVQVTSGIGAFLHLLKDTAAIGRWVENAERVEILGSAAPHSNIVHTYFSAIWPVSPRDMVTQSVWSQDPEGVLRLLVTDMGQHYPLVPGYVRMQQVKSQWTLTPLAGGKLRIQYQGQADPAGKIPHFIVNRVALNAMFTSLQRLMVVLPDYQQPYPGVTEPTR
jgi:hypothetical protein